jgi:hypothetical protein
MNAHATEFRQCLVGLDIVGMRHLWLLLYPHMPQPRDDEEVLATLHLARTQANSLPVKQRAYSHRWLLDHDYPSALPDHLKQKAERLYPKLVTAVGISVNYSANELKPAARLIEKAMSDAVEDAYANGDDDPVLVKRLLMDVGRLERRRLFG